MNENISKYLGVDMHCVQFTKSYILWYTITCVNGLDNNSCWIVDNNDDIDNKDSSNNNNNNSNIFDMS